MSRDTWDQYFLKLAFKAATRSKDDSIQVGAVIVGPDRDIRSTGYNGLPRGIETFPPREKKYYTEHAERNAIYLMARRGDASLGCTLYCTLLPCMDCVRGIIQAGIVRVCIPDTPSEYDFTLPGRESYGYHLSMDTFEEAGISVEKII